MPGLFNKTSLKFIIGFIAIIAISLVFTVIAGFYGDVEDDYNPSPDQNLAGDETV